jgi:restriction system protein
VSDNRVIVVGDGILVAQGNAAVTASATLTELPRDNELLLQAFVTYGPKTPEGVIIEAVTTPWFAILKELERTPNFVSLLDWRQWEEFIAGAYELQGWQVVLTPRSNDKGKDIIATRDDLSIRVFDQVKAYSLGRRVDLAEVDAMLGTLSRDLNVSQGIITTTAEFAPGVYDAPGIRSLMPYRLRLRDGKGLLEWMKTAAAARAGEPPKRAK